MNNLGDWRGDSADHDLGEAMGVFGAFGLLQLVVALGLGRMALALDGLHNLSEYGILGLNRLARRRSGQKPGFFVCRIAPLAPTVSSVVAVVGAALLLTFQHAGHGRSGVVLALGLEGFSLSINLRYARKMHFHAGEADHDDHSVHFSSAHLAGDTVAAGVATLAYLGIWTLGWFWLDQVAGIGGTIVVVAIHMRPVSRSLREFLSHFGPEHNH